MENKNENIKFHTILTTLRKQKASSHLPTIVYDNKLDDKPLGYRHSITGEIVTKRVVIPLVKSKDADIEFYQEVVSTLSQAFHLLFSAALKKKITQKECQIKIEKLCANHGIVDKLDLKYLKEHVTNFNYYNIKETISKLDEEKKLNYLKQYSTIKNEGEKENDDAKEDFDDYIKVLKVLEEQDSENKVVSKSKKRKQPKVTYYPGVYKVKPVKNTKTGQIEIKTEHKNKVSEEKNFEMLLNSLNDGANTVFLNRVPGSSVLYTIHCYGKGENEIDISDKALFDENTKDSIHQLNLSTNKFFIYNSSVGAKQVTKRAKKK